MGTEEIKGDPNLVKPLVDLWIHQNQLMWGRVQLLIALQGAVFAANYALADRWASVGLCIAAILASLYLIYIWDVDRLIRDKYSKILDEEHGFHIGYTPEERKRIPVAIIPGIRVPAIANSKTSLRIIFEFLIVCDLIVLAVSLCVFKT